MKRNRKALWLCVVMLAFLLSGCGGKTRESALPVSGEPEVPITLKNNGEKGKLVLAQVDHGAGRTALLQEIAEKYRADFPNTEIEIRTLPDEAAVEKLVSSGEQADLLEVTEKEAAAWAKQGLLLDMAPYMELWMESGTLSTAAKQASKPLGGGRVYLLPHSTAQKVFYYRADWFSEYSQAHPEEDLLLIPTTWKEMERAVGALSDRGAGLAAAGDSLLDYMNALVWSTVPASKVADVSAGYFARGEDAPTVFTLEEAQAGLEQFQRIFSAGLSEKALAYTAEEAREEFLEGRAAILLGDREDAAYMREMPEGTWGVRPIPRGDSGLSVTEDEFSGWAVAATAENQELAVHFLCFLSNADNNTHFAKENDSVPVHTVAPSFDPFFSQGEQRVYTEILNHADWYQYASMPKMYRAYTGYEQLALEKLRKLLGGELSAQDMLFWLDEYWSSAREEEGALWVPPEEEEA